MSEEDNIPYPIEPITKAVLNRYVSYPVQYPDLKKFAVDAQNLFWKPTDVDFSRDSSDWDKCDEKSRTCLSTALAFFAGADSIVNENIDSNFLNEHQVHEIKSFYCTQISTENVHQETYSLQIVTLIKDPKEQIKLFEAIKTYPSIIAKADFCTKYMQKTKFSLAKRTLCFILVEGLFFSTSFAIIFYFKKLGLFPGVCFANEYIARDEGLHTAFACHLYRQHMIYKLSRKEIVELFTEAVKIEKNFVKDALPEGLLGFSSDMLQDYVECVANKLLDMIGEEKMFNKSNPFNWLEMISIDGKSNFFEKKVSEYSKASIQVNKNTSFDFKNNDF